MPVGSAFRNSLDTRSAWFGINERNQYVSVHSDNEKEEKHGGILGAFSVDNIKWEPGNDEDASLVSFRYPYEDFPRLC